MAGDGIIRMVSERTGRISWRARISFTDASGKRCQRSKSFRSKAAAVKWRRDQLAAIDRGEYFEAQPDTVGDVAARWLADITRSREPSTAMHYRRWYERVIAPVFASRKIGRVTPAMVQQFYAELGTRYAGGTVGHVHKLMRGIFGYALTHGLIRSDPTERRHIAKDRRAAPTVLTPAEARRFADHAADDPYGPILIVMLATGIRIGEAMALHWEDIDLDARTARIHRTAQRGDAGWHIADRAKTRSSERTVALPQRAVAVLRCLPRTDALVFPHPTRGGMVADGTIRTATERVCRAANVPSITPHGLRRTAATLLMMNGTHPRVAADMLGHAVEMMLRLYTQANVDMQHQAADALDTALGDGSGVRSEAESDDDGEESPHV